MMDVYRTRKGRKGAKLMAKMSYISVFKTMEFTTKSVKKIGS